MSFEMDDFEKRLVRAMRRVDAPPNVAKFLALATEVHAERELPRSERKHRWAVKSRRFQSCFRYHP